MNRKHQYHEDYYKLEKIKSENLLAWRIISEIKNIERMNDEGFDTSWEKDLLIYRKVNELLAENKAID